MFSSAVIIILLTFSRLESLIIEFMVSGVSLVSISYLLWNHRHNNVINRVEKTKEYFDVQGTIHSCEMMLVATSVMLAALIDVEENEYRREVYLKRARASIAVDGHVHEEHADSNIASHGNAHESLRSAMSLVYRTLPFYLFFSLMLIQVRHYTFVHNDHLTPEEARERTGQFLEQYHMEPLERELVNSKSWHQFLMEFWFTAPVYPQATCGVKEDFKKSNKVKK